LKLIIRIPDKEAYRDIECEEENIRATYRELSNVIMKFIDDKKIEGAILEVIFTED
jgi:hypothetical protein